MEYLCFLYYFTNLFILSRIKRPDSQPQVDPSRPMIKSITDGRTDISSYKVASSRVKNLVNNAVYTAEVAPSRPKSGNITDGRTDEPTDEPTDGHALL